MKIKEDWCILHQSFFWYYNIKPIIMKKVSDCCEAEITSYMKDLDGTNLVDQDKCTQCGYDCEAIEVEDDTD